jgi:hypothetical protein
LIHRRLVRHETVFELKHWSSSIDPDLFLFDHCVLAMKILLERPYEPVAYSAISVDTASKARICASVLTEARRLADAENFGPLLNQLIARACELLDDIDEILIALDPVRDGGDFANAARLHRELEYIQAIVPARWRGRIG